MHSFEIIYLSDESGAPNAVSMTFPEADIMRRRTRGACRSSGRRADRWRCVRPASPRVPLPRGARACGGAIHRVRAGSPRRDRAGRNRRRIVQRKRCPTSSADSMMVLRASCGGTGSNLFAPERRWRSYIAAGKSGAEWFVIIAVHVRNGMPIQYTAPENRHL
jgi:hypothetical protein